MAISSKIESLIADAPLSAHLATAVDDRPHVAPVWYGYRDGVLYFITGGRKLANIRRNPRVALSIERANGGDVEWNVLLRGTATIRDEPERIDWASGWIYEKYDGGDDTETNDDGTDEQATDEETDTTTESDDGESAEEQTAALIEVAIGSASVNVYE